MLAIENQSESTAKHTPADLIKPYQTEPTGDERILILCEGEKTEPKYLHAFIEQYGLPSDRIVVRCVKAAQHPLAMAKWAAGELLYASYLAQSDSDKLPYTEVWCVFDRDGHTDFDDALEFIAPMPNIHAVPSNPCFELWLLHHFVPWRKEFIGRGDQIGKPVVKLEKAEDGNVREIITTLYTPANPSQLCFDELRKNWGGYDKAFTTPIKNFPERVSNAMRTDMPVEARQAGVKDCWTLVPHLLVRLMRLKYDAKETAALLDVPIECVGGIEEEEAEYVPEFKVA